MKQHKQQLRCGRCGKFATESQLSTEHLKCFPPQVVMMSRVMTNMLQMMQNPPTIKPETHICSARFDEEVMGPKLTCQACNPKRNKHPADCLCSKCKPPSSFFSGGV